MTQQVDLAAFIAEALVSARKRVAAYPPLTRAEVEGFILMAEDRLGSPPEPGALRPEVAIIILLLCLRPPSLEAQKELRGDARLPGL